MEMSREPSLDTTMLPDQLDKLLALLLITVIQPTASIDDVILLQDPQSTSIRRSVREDEDLPTLVGGMRLDQILEPIDLLLIDRDLVTGVNGIPEQRGSHAHQQGLVGDLPAELRSLLPVRLEVRVQVLLVRLEFVQSLQIVIPPHDVVRDVEATEEFRRHFVTLGGPREQFRIALGIVIAIFRLAEISQADDGNSLAVGLGLVEDGEEVGASGAVIFHFARVDVEIAQDGHDVFVGAGAEGGGGGAGMSRGGDECRRWGEEEGEA
mmetsp:Transcript_19692/g.31896  ORF Transcript_19692/g.31896 Transcript_19692/m.31896 type:complete len:266 (-) Transcript_19692:78-875(-)